MYLQHRHGWCHMKLLPPWHILCTPYNFMQSHTCKVYACLPVTCHLHFWQNNHDLLHATWGNTGAEQTVDPGEGNSCAAPAGI